METKDSTFHLEPHGQQNVAGAIFVDHSNRPFLFMIATLRYARQWFRPVGLQFVAGRLSGSANAKFKSV